ncbi:hypothetical protein GCM10023187_48530 [Nibrella viscosa]|uniref:Uncharacterized protein n=1 Tax=Nibrella viscosa TaxID=1084524 RepID=A0ABP8KW65_9BACT
MSPEKALIAQLQRENENLKAAIQKQTDYKEVRTRDERIDFLEWRDELLNTHIEEVRKLRAELKQAEGQRNRLEQALYALMSSTEIENRFN